MSLFDVIVLMCFFVVLFLFRLVSSQPTLSGYSQFLDLSGYMFNGNTHMSQPMTYNLYYSYGPGYIYLGIVADTGDTTGYTSFGVNTVGQMIGSDAAIGTNFAAPSIDDFDLKGKSSSTSNTFCLNGIGAVCIDTDVGSGGVSIGCQDNILNKTVTRVGTYLILQYARPIAASDSCDLPMTAGVIQSCIFFSF